MSERRWQDGALVDRKRRLLPWRRNDKTHRPGSAIHEQPVPSTPRASGTCSQSRLEVLPKITQARLRSPPLRLPKRFRTNLPGHAAAAVGSVRTSLSMMLGARFAPDPSSDQSPWAGMNNLHVQPGLRSSVVKFQNTSVYLTWKGLEPLACHGKIKVGTGCWCGYCLRLSIIGTLREVGLMVL